jgi:co-chaperonin GroES (HSP10)
MFIPVGKNIIIKHAEYKDTAQTDSGIILDEGNSSLDQSVGFGEVISVGDEVTKVKEGSNVIYELHAGYDFVVAGEKYASVQEANILGYEEK